MGNLESPMNLSPLTACLCSSWEETWENPHMQTPHRKAAQRPESLLLKCNWKNSYISYNKVSQAQRWKACFETNINNVCLSDSWTTFWNMSFKYTDQLCRPLGLFLKLRCWMLSVHNSGHMGAVWKHILPAHQLSEDVALVLQFHKYASCIFLKW